MPTHVLPISSWMSPWFHAKPGLTHALHTACTGVDVVKKKSGLPNIVNVGVRFGSALTMCSVFSSTGVGERRVSGTVCTGPMPLRTYGSSERQAADVPLELAHRRVRPSRAGR